MSEITSQVRPAFKKEPGLQEVPVKFLRQAKGLVRPLIPEAQSAPAEEKLDLSLMKGLDVIIQQVLLDTGKKKIEDVTLSEMDRLFTSSHYYELADNYEIDQVLHNLSQALQSGNFTEILQRVSELRSADQDTTAFFTVIYDNDSYRKSDLFNLANQTEEVMTDVPHFQDLPTNALKRLDTLRKLTTAVKAALPGKPTSNS